MPGYERIVENGITTLKRDGDWYNADTNRTLESDSTDWEAWIADYIKEQSLDHIAWEGSPEDRGASAKEMYEELIKDECPDEVAKDLTLLVCYDLVVLVDDSTTMLHKDRGARIETLISSLSAICDVYKLVRASGVISVKFLNTAQGRKNFTADKAKKLRKEIVWKGVTRIGTELKRKILDNFVFKGKEVLERKKPLLIVVITDGEVEGEEKGLLESVVTKCIEKTTASENAGKNAVKFQFAHVGSDPDAEKLLRRLHDNKKIEIKDNVSALLSDKLEDIKKPNEKWTVLPNLLLGSIVKRWKPHQTPLVLDGFTPDDGDDDVEEELPEDIDEPE